MLLLKEPAKDKSHQIHSSEIPKIYLCSQHYFITNFHQKNKFIEGKLQKSTSQKGKEKMKFRSNKLRRVYRSEPYMRLKGI